MSDQTLLAVGTKKGLFLFTSKDRRRWKIQGPFQTGKEINHARYDLRTGRLYATANDAWFGSEIVWSDNLGKAWRAAKTGPGFKEGADQKLERIWHVEPGPASEPKVLYAGVAPAALFRSEDSGKTWREIEGLAKHPSRARWHPGAGGLCLHSILIDPNYPQRIYVGISAAGVFRSDDAGATWRPANRGTRAEFLPQKYPEFGQCVHKLLLAPGGKPLLFQQNHCGVYRSDTGGDQWKEITKGLPSDFGFPLAIHPRKPETIFVIPLKGADFRCPPGNKLRVFRSRNGGTTWQALARGLPQENAFMGIYREAMAMDSSEPAGVYFGTNTGKLFGSDDEGESWGTIADNLPPIYSVEAAVLSSATGKKTSKRAKK